MKNTTEDDVLLMSTDIYTMPDGSLVTVNVDGYVYRLTMGTCLNSHIDMENEITHMGTHKIEDNFSYHP